MKPNVYPSIEVFRAMNDSAPKWRALEEAATKAQSNPRTWARAVRASLTYWTEAAEQQQDFTNSQMYQTLIVAGSEPVEVQVATIEDLTPTCAYCDQSDTQHFEGSGTTVQLQPGAVLAVAPSQAWRYGKNDSSVKAHRFRVTLVGSLPQQVSKVAA